MNDVLGTKFEAGQIVEMALSAGMFRGRVVEVHDTVIAVPGRPPMPPHVMIEIMVPKFKQDPNNPTLAAIYVVGQVVKAAELGEEKPPSTIITN